MNAVDRHHDVPGPGTRRDPKRKVVARWTQGNHNFVRLTCTHVVRAPKSIDFKEGTGVHCPRC